MIWYIIIAAVFFFQSGYVTCTENIVSMTNGADVDLNSEKFMASIYVKSSIFSGSSRFQCAGVIVHKDYILTLAACVRRTNKIFTVHVGITYRGRGYRERVVHININQNFTATTGNIALLKLNNSLPISNVSDRYAPIALPNVEFEARSGMNITVIGYGRRFQERKYRLWKVTIEALNSGHVSIYSFCAKNDNIDGSKLDYEDRGCPAFYDGIFVGMVVLAGRNPDCPVALTNIFKVKDFIVENIPT